MFIVMLSYIYIRGVGAHFVVASTALSQSQAPYRSGNELQSATPHMFLNASMRK